MNHAAPIWAATHRPASRWRAATAFVGAVFLLTAFYFWTYRDCLHVFFHFDDYWVLSAASRIHIHSPVDVRQFFEPVNGFLLYRPVSTLLYFYILHALFGYDPTGYHAAQLAVHVTNALLAYLIADTLFFSRRLALATALVYATAPGHAIAVCWNALFTVTGTALFYFLGLWMWMRLDGRWRMPLTFLLFGTALLASEHAVSFPIVLLLGAIVLQPRDTWRRTFFQLTPHLVVAGTYIAAKLYYVHFSVQRAFPEPGVAQFIEKAYAVSLSPASMLDHLGKYVGFSVAAAYGLVRLDVVALPVGVLVALGASAATYAVLSGRWTTRCLRVATFGLDMFVITLGQVLVLPAHIFSYYVGIAALGMALALVGFSQALLRLPNAGPWVLVTLLLVVHLSVTARLVRRSDEFQFFEGFSQAAVQWLYTLSVRADDPVIDEVIVPSDPVTNYVFNLGQSHKLFLCAPYAVRIVDNIDAIGLARGRLVIRAPDPLPAAYRHGPWAWMRRGCS